MTPTGKLRAAVFKRARGICECGCEQALGEGRLDHVFGRSKAPESLSNTWALRIQCDEAKTANRPSAAHWLMRFGEHAKRYGFTAELERARSKYLALKVKGFAP